MSGGDAERSVEGRSDAHATGEDETRNPRAETEAGHRPRRLSAKRLPVERALAGDREIARGDALLETQRLEDDVGTAPGGGAEE